MKIVLVLLAASCIFMFPVAAHATGPAPAIVLTLSPGDTTGAVNADISETASAIDRDTITQQGGDHIVGDRMASTPTIHGNGMSVTITFSGTNPADYTAPDGVIGRTIDFTVKATTAGTYYPDISWDDQAIQSDDTPASATFAVVVS